MEPKPKVLFLSTRDSSRSQMAEGFLRKLAGDRFEVYSAGLDPKPIHPLTIMVMAEVGIDIGNQQSKSIKEVLGRHNFQYVFFVCDQAYDECPRVYPGFGERPYWPFEDPQTFEGTNEEKLAKYREVRDQIRDRIESWLEEITKRRMT